MKLWYVFLLVLSCAAPQAPDTSLLQDVDDESMRVIRTMSVGPGMEEGVNGVLIPKHRPITWKFSCDFPRGMRDDVSDGFEYWDEQTDNGLFVELDCSQSVDIVIRHISKYHRIKTWWASTGTRKRHGNWHSANITFYKSWLENTKGSHEFRRSISRHEVGHALGFDHLPDTACIMYRWMNTKDTSALTNTKQLCAYERNLFERYYGGRAEIQDR